MPSWRFAHLLTAPHRLAFATAGLVLAVASGWWAVVQAMSEFGLPVRWALDPVVAHALVMTFGFMPPFFCGFLFTAGPRWLGRPAVEASTLWPAMLPLLAGWGVFALGVHGRDPDFGHALGAIGLGAVAVGWGTAWRAFDAMSRSAAGLDRSPLGLVRAAGVVGVLTMAGSAIALATRRDELARAAAQAGLWGFVGVTFAALSNRMRPLIALADRARAPTPAPGRGAPQELALPAIVAALVVEGVARAATLVHVAPPTWLSAWLGVAETALGAAVAWTAARSLFTQARRLRMVAMLDAGLAWFGVSLVLAGLAHLGAAPDVPGFDRAPLHAFTIGFLGSTMLATVSRVSAGHAGRAVVADDLLWRLFLVLQATAALRVVAVVAAAVPGLRPQALVAAAAIGWAGVFVAWSARHGRWYGLPREGRPAA